MPVVPGSLSQTSYSPYYEWGHPKREPGLGATKVEEGDETESNHFSFGAEHTEDPNRFVSLKPYQQRYPPIEMSIQNYTDAGDDGTRPFPKGRQMALHGSMGELFAYQDKDGNYRVYDGASLSQGEGATAAKQVGGWDDGPLFDAYDTDFGNEAAPGWDRPDETPNRISGRMELLEVMATALSQAHPNAKLFPYRGDTPVAPNPELFKKSWNLMKMPFHGTTTGVLEGIRRRGLQPQQADAFTPPSVWYSQSPEQAIGFANIRSDLTRGKDGGDPVLLQFPQEAVKNPNRRLFAPTGDNQWTEHPIPASAITEHHGPPKPKNVLDEALFTERGLDESSEDKWDEWQNSLDEWKKELMLRYEQGEFS